MSDTIFQPTDLAQRRVEFLEAARTGGARLRDKDGTSLVMLPESRIALLEQLATWSRAHLRLAELSGRDQSPSISDLGELAWLRVFDQEELAEFATELQNALVAAHADGDVSALTASVEAWRRTAKQLEDPLRRSVLRGELALSEFLEIERPDGAE